MIQNLPTEEATALSLLSAFDAIEKKSLEYALSVLCGKPNNMWYLNRMARYQMLFADGNHFKSSPMIKPTDGTDRCYWVLMQYIKTLDIATLQKEVQPDGVSFIRDNKIYRIVAANPNPDTTISLLDRISTPDIKLIVVVRTEKDLEAYANLNDNISFAVVKPHAPGTIPEVSFYQKKAVVVR